MSPIRILGICGSLRRGSTNGALLRVAIGLEVPAAVVQPWGGLAAIPPFDEDGETEAPAAVTDMRAAIGAADAVLVSTPEYNGSIPGQLKNALDWASRPFGDSVLTGTPVAVLSASPSAYGAVTAASHLAAVLARRFALASADTSFDADGRLVDPAHTAGVTALVHELVDVAAARRSSRSAA